MSHHVLEKNELNSLLMMYGELGKERHVSTTDEDDAALKMQKLQRGRSSRKSLVVSSSNSSSPIATILSFLARVACLDCSSLGADSTDGSTDSASGAGLTVSSGLGVG